jgi:hypothetical protein
VIGLGLVAGRAGDVSGVVGVHCDAGSLWRVYTRRWGVWAVA